jgi:CHAT domain-containing protein
MVRRGKYDDALALLSGYQDDLNHPEETIRKLAAEADALTSQQRFAEADQRLSLGQGMCRTTEYISCGYVLRGMGILAVRQGRVSEADQIFLKYLSFARTHRDRFLEARAFLNLGWTSLQTGHFDEAAEWSRSAYRTAVDLGAEDTAQIALGNLGSAYYQLGDDENALEIFLEAERKAASLGDTRYELKWISNAGYIYHDTGDPNRAMQSYRQALYLAKQIDSKEDIVNALEDLAEVSVETGKLEEASAYIDQVTPMENSGGNRLSANIMLTQGMLAAARHQDQLAESIFRAVQNDPTAHTTTRLGAGNELGKLFERQGKMREAQRTYVSTLNDFESARAQLRNADSRLPFSANAANIYDNYIRLLVQEGKSDEALAAADQSRARTLAQGLGTAESEAHLHRAALNPRQVAQKTGATLLFYWLGDQHSYLWAITPAKVALIELPSQAEIVARIERYRKALLDVEDPLQTQNDDGQALYKLLVGPAAKLIRRDAPVMILADGELSKLNFETLLVPGPSVENHEGPASTQKLHYLLDDATLLSAPSLSMLAAAKPARNRDRNLLLLGDPVSPNQDYPSLPLFGSEMTQIERHFAPQQLGVFAGRQATPAAYLTGNPAQYSYIHFVSHAVASRTDPLDSAIILSGSALSGSTLSGSTLSGSKTSEASFKLYARDIMQHPIDARLVTISACYGSGTRSYAGEGLVGLSWAFLRAGAHSVIGALWEVSDDSTPRLMDTLYQGIENGKEPAVALRNAKLTLLHSRSKFQTPFYWAPFQIYTRR